MDNIENEFDNNFNYMFSGSSPKKNDDTQAMEYMPGGGSGLSREDLEAQRRDLRRQQFYERAKLMGLDMNNVADLEMLFAEQELIEQEKEREQENDYGISM